MMKIKIQRIKKPKFREIYSRLKLPLFLFSCLLLTFFGVITLSPLTHAQTGSTYWNVERDGSNNLNFYLTNNGTNATPALQIMGNGIYSNIILQTKLGLSTGSAGADSGVTGDRPYQWGYQEGGAWTGTTRYPDLILGYHTGVKMGAHPAYGGVRFYNEHPSRATTELFSVGDGDNNVRVANWLLFPNLGYGLMSSTNGALFQSNNATYGGWRMTGSRNGWGGLEFDSPTSPASNVTLMVGHPSQAPGSQYTGMHLNGTGWLWYAVGNNMHASQFTDMNNGGYYVDPASSSNVNALQASSVYRTYGFNGYEYDGNNSGYYVDPSYVSQFSYLYRTYGFNGVEYDANNTGYYVDPNGTSLYNDLRANVFYDMGNTGYYLDPQNASVLNDVRANIFYDQANTGYYTMPRGRSRMNDSHFDYLSCMSSWCPTNQLMRLTPNVHFNSVTGYAVYLNWDNGYNPGLQFTVGNGQGGYAMFLQGNGYMRNMGTTRHDGLVGMNGYEPGGCGGYGLCVGAGAYSQSGWASGSDIRLKDDIKPITKALDKILSLEGVTFKWKDASKEPGGSTGTHFGFIAQQAEPIIPDAVITNADGYKAMDYPSLTALLTEGIKEQQQQINSVKEASENEKKVNESQEQKLKLMEQQIEMLKAEIAELKANK